MDYPIPFGDFADEIAGIPGEEFAARFPHGFLEAHFQGAGYEPGGHEGLSATSNAGPGAFHIEESRKAWRTALLFALQKSDRNKIEGRITLGRAPVNDVVIPHGSVSKIHALFKKDLGTGYFTIYDAGSRFGTEVDRVPLREGEGIALKSQTEIVLAKSVHLLFFTPKDFFNYLRLKTRTGKTDRLLPPGPGGIRRA
ncbi:MAG: FHA domain-containing protein [Planctomycetes bacterium]|jgi:hypothetical protein|nr:FHA domain-containing protein [Planctomycetota bacterium]